MLLLNASFKMERRVRIDYFEILILYTDIELLLAIRVNFIIWNLINIFWIIIERSNVKFYITRSVLSRKIEYLSAPRIINKFNKISDIG